MLPTYATAFFGRRDALDAIARHEAAGRRVLTLLGPAGVGKTRLAVASSAAHAAVIFCDLRAARTRDDVVDALLRGLRLAVDIARVRGDVARRAGAWLRARGPVRVVLDNFEQLVPHAVDLLGIWSDAAPEATFVVTSRHPLRAAGEALVAVDPLGLSGDDPAAVALFCDRAGFALSPDERRAVGDIVRALDGIPLAIELAAARLEVMSVGELRERLRERFALLRQPDANGAVDHHATLWGALEWSWQLLAPAERACLAQCAAFDDGFTLRSAEAVLRLDGASALDALHALRQKSLLRVTHGEPHRFSLYESVREFGLHKLDASGESEAARARVTAHVLDEGAAWAARARGPDARLALDRLDAERGNLLAALRRAAADPAGGRLALRAALALEPVLAARGLATLHLATLDDALAAADPIDPLYAHALLARGLTRRYLGRLDEARDDLARALDLARAHGDVVAEGEGLVRLGSVVALLGDIDSAEALHREALALSERNGDARGRGVALSLLGTTHSHRDGQRERALGEYVEAAALLRAAGDPFAEHVNLMRLGAAFLELGRFDECEAALGRLVAQSDALGDPYAARMGRGYLAVVRHLQGRLDEARSLYADAVAAGRALLDPQYQATYSSYLGLLLAEAGEAGDASALLAEAAAVIEPTGDLRVASFVRCARAAVDAVGGRFGDARASLDAARALLAAQHLADFPRLADAAGGLLELEAAGARFAAGDRADLAAALDRNRALHAALRDLPSDEVRLAARLLERSLERWSLASAGWSVAADGAWFEPPSGPRVSLSTRATLAALLAALVRRRGEGLTLAALQASAWPGEKLAPKVAANRVHVALSSLRKMGLDPLLKRTEEGYCIDPAAAVTVVAADGC